MPQDTKHPQYEHMVSDWELCLDAVAGEREVKRAGTKYLPMLGGQKSESYDSYRMRASFYGATGRTVEGMAGVVFRKDPIINWPKRDMEFLQTVGSDDAPIESVMRHCFQRVLTLARHGILLDLDDSEITGQVFPFMTHYSALDILNWRAQRIGERQVLTLVVLAETDLREDASDPYKLTAEPLIRVLRLLTPGSTVNVGTEEITVTEPVYYIEVYERRKNQSGNATQEWQLVATRVPKVRGKSLTEIPFVIFGPNDLGVSVDKPPVLDLANLNLSHYRSSADLEHGRHFTALPTAWVAGFKVDTELRIGSQVAWVSEDPQASAGFLEFTGQGLGALETALTQKESQMTVLGARLLEAPKRAVEAADTHKIRKVGEDSIVASIASTVSLGFERLLKMAASWRALGDKAVKDIAVELNTDYSSVEMSPQMLQALLLSLQSGRISYDTFIYNLSRGELLPEGRTMEEEIELINATPIPGASAGDDLGSENEDDLEDEDEDDLEDENNPKNKGAK